MSVFVTRRGVVPKLYDPVFANNSWEDIIESCQSGKIPDEWAVGDQKAMTIDGTSYMVDIIGKNHDVYSDGSGVAPLTFQLHDVYGNNYTMNNTDTNSGGWGSSVMRTVTLPSLLAVMPNEVQVAIKEVNKLTSAGSGSATIDTTADKLFFLSEIEVYGSASYSKTGEGTQYAYYANGGSKVKKFGSAVEWWERSPHGANTTSFCLTTGSGTAMGQNATLRYYPSFAFCF